MKIEAGKYYKNRNGGKTYIVGPNRPDEKTYRWVGRTHDGEFETWTDEGIYSTDDTSAFDLVAEWEEPVGEPDEWLYVGVDSDGDYGNAFTHSEYKRTREDFNEYVYWIKIPAYRVDNG